MALFDRERLYNRLTLEGHGEWASELRSKSLHALEKNRHGTLETWITAWNQLPSAENAQLIADRDAVTIAGDGSDVDRELLRQQLMTFHPWRKGPFEFPGLPIDTEWRSYLKWNRLASRVNFRNCRVLDVGCGNGYYGWRMLDAGANLVLGFDPFLLFLMQFEVIRRYADSQAEHYVLPLTDQDIPERLNFFNVTLSMGVLYHRTSPIDHLQALWHSLRTGGTLVLETLIVESDTVTCLMPEDRYAKMRNVWFIPSIATLQIWLKRTGFRDVEVLDISPTTTFEQRRTEWMTFESLADFLDPTDASRTIESYPAPVRAILLARKV